MEKENSNKEKNYSDFVEVFKSIGKEKRFITGEIITSFNSLPREVFLIKSGTARVITTFNNKFVSVAKLANGDFIGIASILNGKPIGEIRAAEELVVYGIEEKEFKKVFNKEISIRTFCQNNIWIEELLFILKNFPNIYKKNLFLSTNLLAVINSKSKIVDPNLDNLKNYLKNRKLLFSSSSYEEDAIWSEIRSLSQIEKILREKREFPVRIISIPKNIEIKKTRKINQFNLIKNDKFNEINNTDNIYLESRSILNEAFENKKLLIASKGHLENTLSCFEMLSEIMQFPFKSESSRRILDQYIKNNQPLSLTICGEIAKYHNLQISILKVKSSLIYRLQTPALINWEENFAVLLKSDKNGITILLPNKDSKNISYRNLNNIFPNGIEILNLEKTNLTQKKLFELNWFYPFLKNYKGVFLQILIAGFVIQLLTLSNPLLIQIIIDKVISQRSLDTLQILGIALLIVTLFEGVLNSLKTFLLADTSNRIDKRISSEIIDHLLGLPLNFFQKRRSGELSSRIGELEKIRNFLTSQALTTMLDAIFSLIYILVMIAYSIKLTIISFIVLPIQILLVFICGPLFKKQSRNVAETNAKTQSHFIEILNGIETVKSQNIESKSHSIWQRLYNKYINKSFEKIITGTVFLQTSQSLQKISQILILWFGADMVLQGYLSLGQLIAFRIISSYVTMPLLRLSNIWQEIQELRISFERLADIINTKKEINEFEKDKILIPQIKGLINFKNVNFKFENEQNFILNNINLSIKSNNFIAIVGQSGSGKSTFLKLIYRLFRPSSGNISIDNYDIEKVELKSLRSQIGFVAQDSLLFKGTIKENIALRDNQISDEKIIKASKIACAHNFIMDLPKGYSTLVSEKGSSLSGGQRQRIALARTFLNDPKILLLDEATSALDFYTEKECFKNLFNHLNKKTIVCVSHRLSTIRNADLIVVLHKGRIDEIGDHKELIEKRGRYFALLHESQDL